MAWRQLTAAGVAFAATVHSGVAQQPAPQRAPGTLTEGVTAVLVDVVVRDRKNQPVRDLTQADFEVLEDGVPQTIGAFAAVREGITIQPSEATAGPSAAATTAPAATPAAIGSRAPAAGGPPV